MATAIDFHGGKKKWEKLRQKKFIDAAHGGNDSQKRYDYHKNFCEEIESETIELLKVVFSKPVDCIYHAVKNSDQQKRLCHLTQMVSVIFSNCDKSSISSFFDDLQTKICEDLALGYVIRVPSYRNFNAVEDVVNYVTSSFSEVTQKKLDVESNSYRPLEIFWQQRRKESRQKIVVILEDAQSLDGQVLEDFLLTSASYEARGLPFVIISGFAAPNFPEIVLPHTVRRKYFFDVVNVSTRSAMDGLFDYLLTTSNLKFSPTAFKFLLEEATVNGWSIEDLLSILRLTSLKCYSSTLRLCVSSFNDSGVPKIKDFSENYFFALNLLVKCAEFFHIDFFGADCKQAACKTADKSFFESEEYKNAFLYSLGGSKTETVSQFLAHCETFLVNNQAKKCVVFDEFHEFIKNEIRRLKNVDFPKENNENQTVASAESETKRKTRTALQLDVQDRIKAAKKARTAATKPIVEYFADFFKRWLDWRTTEIEWDVLKENKEKAITYFDDVDLLRRIAFPSTRKLMADVLSKSNWGFEIFNVAGTRVNFNDWHEAYEETNERENAAVGEKNVAAQFYNTVSEFEIFGLVGKSAQRKDCATKLCWTISSV